MLDSQVTNLTELYYNRQPVLLFGGQRDRRPT